MLTGKVWHIKLNGSKDRRSAKKHMWRWGEVGVFGGLYLYYLNQCFKHQRLHACQPWMYDDCLHHYAVKNRHSLLIKSKLSHLSSLLPLPI